MGQEISKESGLVIRIQGKHMIVTDGCQIETLESNMVGDEKQRRIDYIERATSRSQNTRRSLWYRNIVVARLDYYKGKPIDLRCPSCGKDYTMVKEDFIPAVEECRRLRL